MYGRQVPREVKEVHAKYWLALIALFCLTSARASASIIHLISIIVIMCTYVGVYVYI